MSQAQAPVYAISNTPTIDYTGMSGEEIARAIWGGAANIAPPAPPPPQPQPGTPTYSGQYNYQSQPTVYSDANIRETTIPSVVSKAQTTLPQNNTSPAVGSMEYDIANKLPIGTSSRSDYRAPTSTSTTQNNTGGGSTSTGTSPSRTTSDPTDPYSAVLDFYTNSNAVADSAPISTLDQQSLDEIAKSRAQNTQMYNAYIGNIMTYYAQRQARMEEDQAAQHAGDVQAALLGGSARYSPFSTSGLFSAQERQNMTAINELHQKETDEVLAAQKAMNDGDFQLLGKKLDIINKIRDTKTAVAKDLATKMYETNKAQAEAKQKVADQKTKDINGVIDDASKNGAPKEVIAAISKSTDLSSAVTAAGEYLQGGTGIVGEYNAYKRDATARGHVPISFDEYQTIDANRKIKLAGASDPSRILSANEAQALGVPFGTTAGDAYGKTPQKPATETQQKDAAFAQRTSEANKVINTLQKDIAGMNSVSFSTQKAAENTTVGNTFVDDKIKQVRQAERNFLNSILRRESGAAISATEFESGEKQYFPRPGDDATTLEQKRQNRETQIKNLEKSAGPALDSNTASTTDHIIKTEEDAKTAIINYGTKNPDKQVYIKKIINSVDPDLGRIPTYQEALQILGVPQSFSSVGGDTNQASKIAMAIKDVETGGNYSISGASGEHGAYQFMPDTWKAWSKQYLGDANAPMTQENQDKVATAKIADLLNQGHTPYEVALIWNGGEAKEKKGVNNKGVAYDSGAYARKVLKKLS